MDLITKIALIALIIAAVIITIKGFSSMVAAVIGGIITLIYLVIMIAAMVSIVVGTIRYINKHEEEFDYDD